MKSTKTLIFLINVFIMCLTSQLHATRDGSQDAPLEVAVILAEPFGMVHDESHYGIAVDLWKQIAADNEWKYHFTSYKIEDYSELIKKLQKNDIDVIVGPTTASADREELVDFSRPFYLDYIGTIVEASIVHSVLNIIEMFLYSAGSLLLIFLTFYTIHIHLIWLFERKHSKSIPKEYFNGVMFVLWQDLSKSHYISTPSEEISIPHSVPVRTSLFLWIGIAYVLTTLISGTVVSFMTVSLTKAETGVQKLGDLDGKVIGALRGTYPLEFGTKAGFKIKPLNSFEEGFKGLADGTISSFLVDHSVAVFKLQKQLNTRLILSTLVLKYNLYGFAVSQGSPLKSRINDSLIKLQDDETVKRLCTEYVPQNVKNCQL